jgi:polysaccharide deacetylase family protein (PEP-CTERM system associated)
MRNALTVDVEDYFQVAAFRNDIRVEDWEHYPLRVVDNTLKVLDLLDEFGVKATFFVLGWVAMRRPTLVREIQSRGHEIGSHGFGHQLVYEIGAERFRDDVRRSKALLEDLCGETVHGYRAPSYSITERNMWALDILIEEGFTYDSSIYPIHHDLYGIPDALRFPHVIRRPGGTIREFPISTLQFGLGDLMQFRLPVGGGGYLRLFPVSLMRYAFNHINQKEMQPAVLYFHPWEIDPGQPRIRSGWKSRFRHYVNLETTFSKLTFMVKSLNFVPMKEVFADGS